MEEEAVRTVEGRAAYQTIPEFEPPRDVARPVNLEEHPLQDRVIESNRCLSVTREES